MGRYPEFPPQEVQEPLPVTAAESRVLDLVWGLLQKVDGKLDAITERVVALETKNSNEVAVDDSVRRNGVSRRVLWGMVIGFAGVIAQGAYDVITAVQHHP